MIFDYLGYTIHRIGTGYVAIGPGLPGLVSASVIEAVNLINGYIAGQCAF